MICIAAFIVLGLLILTLPVIRLFNKKLAQNIWHLFKRSTYCFSRRATFRKCDSSFKDDVKNSLLKKVVLKHPRLIKPLSILIEIISVLIIVVTIWSILVGVKSLVSLYVYGTCNSENPSACSLDNTEACTIESKPISFLEQPVEWLGKWFGDFGEAVAAIPVRMKSWQPADYLPQNPGYYNPASKKPVAVDIFDPSCLVCQKSYKKQKQSGFFSKYKVALLPYPIRSGDQYKFPHSYKIVSLLEALKLRPPKNKVGSLPPEWQIVDFIYSKKAPNGDSYQNAFNVFYGDDEVDKILSTWLNQLGYNDNEIRDLKLLAKSDKVKQIIEHNIYLVEKKIKTKKIPTIIYDGRRHDGEFQAKS